GRNADPTHVRVLPALLEARGIELIRVERGGEVTYHGPGQLVAYPLLRLAERDLLIRPYVRALEAAMAETAAAYGVAATRREGLPGLWVDADGPLPRKVGAVGVRVERGVTYHGIALNVTTELRKDAVTGWWVAVVVDRQFDLERFARTANRVRDGGNCQNCAQPGEGVRVRSLKRDAFHVLGTEKEARELARDMAQAGQTNLATVGEG